MTPSSSELCILIRSRLAYGADFSASGLKDMQHVLTDWFPRAVFADLTDDTTSIDLEIRREFTIGKNLYNATFKRADGTVIKRIDYREEMLTGKHCPAYDRNKSRYDGKEDGFDRRLVYYSANR